MNTLEHTVHYRTTTTRARLSALGHATSRGFGTGVAMIRLVRLARQDAPGAELDYQELNRGTVDRH